MVESNIFNLSDNSHSSYPTTALSVWSLLRMSTSTA